jgi:nicotinamide phosphoribosyltransferase
MATNTDNLILRGDSYKYSQHLQYPPGTEYVYSYIESRGGKWDETLFFGLQIFLKEILSKPMTMADIDEAEEIILAHGLPFNRLGWEYIVNERGGRLPVSISAVPEGTVVPARNVLLTIVNVDPKCFWLTSFVETALLRAVWYPTTVATKSMICKRVIMEYLRKTSDDPEGQISFKLHDFGARGASSGETAAIGGAAHLVNFMGTDTVEALVAARRFYGAGMAGFSIPASEHSTMTAWGRDGEVDAYRNMIRQFAKPGALFACVSDSYDLWSAIDVLWGGSLRQEVIDSGAVLVVRPDSGDPTTVPVEAVRRLARKFGTITNGKGYEVLNHVRVIQGDGIDEDVIPVILENLTVAGFATDNIAFGMGGGLLQQVNRDTQRFAQKASAACIEGKWIEIFKDPATDPGKTSKKGRLALVHECGVWETRPEEGNAWRNQLQRVYLDGRITREWSFDEVRERAREGV